MEKRVREAAEAARLVGKEKTQFAEVPPVTDQITVRMKKDFRQVPLSEKKSVMEKYNRVIMDHHEKIESSDVIYRDTFRKVRYANSQGTYIEDERPDLMVRLSATARDDTNVQKGFESVGGGDGFQLTEGLEEKAKTAAQRAIDLLSAPPVTGGKYTVVLDPKLSETAKVATVAFTTSTYGINTGGTVYRMDDVPIPLRPAFESPYKSDYEILKGIERRIRERQLA